ncbi:tetratricopeptide repeat protein [Streptomyces luteolifulvus]|uniref:tetratricopeptide repeat protein n=1 Tax=Streptomyces luteolifulvus TaxID=2615112 RepID=UPI0038B502F5
MVRRRTGGPDGGHRHGSRARGRHPHLAARLDRRTLAAERLGDPCAQAHVHRSLARAATKLGRTEEARRRMERAVELFTAAGEVTACADSHRQLSWVAERHGDLEAALSHAQQALALQRAAGHSARTAAALNAVGWCHTLLGQHQQALDHCRDALTTHGHRDGRDPRRLIRSRHSVRQGCRRRAFRSLPRCHGRASSRPPRVPLRAPGPRLRHPHPRCSPPGCRCSPPPPSGPVSTVRGRPGWRRRATDAEPACSWPPGA